MLKKNKFINDINSLTAFHYSKSKDENIDLLDLHLVHFIRIFLKQVDEYNLVKTKFEKTKEYINDDNNNIKELG